MGYKKRFNYLIDRDFQLKFLFHFSILLLLGVVMTVSFLYWINISKFDGGAVFRLRQDPIQVYHKGFEIVDGQEVDKYIAKDIYLPDYDHQLNLFSIQLNGIITFSILYLVLIAVFSILKSHKMAGPVYNIKRSLRAIIDGEKHDPIRLRKGDEFHELANLINELVKKKIKN